MFSRLLQLPDDDASRHDLSSLRFVIHGAAPCSVDTKQRMLDWWGPILWEMFAGTEGQGPIVSPQEWLAKPGTVGQTRPGTVAHPRRRRQRGASAGSRHVSTW
jgi:long-chain acyl-CoA synthetase